MKKDKQKVLDEVWTVDHIKSFLELEQVEGIDLDFHTLLRAYQSMRAEDFEQFIGFFCDQKRDLDARGPEGETVLNIIQQHRHGTAYAGILTKAGASH